MLSADENRGEKENGGRKICNVKFRADTYIYHCVASRNSGRHTWKGSVGGGGGGQGDTNCMNGKRCVCS